MGWFGASKRSNIGGGIPRRAERYLTLGLACPLGDVIDLSASGMQVRCHGRPAAARGDTRQFTISSGSQKLDVSGRVVWVKRTSWRGFRLGIHFLHLRPGTEAALVQLARFGFVGRNGPPTTPAPPPPQASIEVEDLYGILGVVPSASPGEVHAAYRTLVRTVHPDVCKDPEASAHFTLVSKAFTVLKDPDRRRKYDSLVVRCA